MTTRTLALTLLIFLLLGGNLLAEPVYKWSDSDGKVHYSSKKPNKEAKPASLPKIMRGEVKISKATLSNCDKHGGVDCSAGPDTDNSTICNDGFKGALTRFKEVCSYPRLEVADISELKQDGSFSVYVRNSKSVRANNAKVSFFTKDNKLVNLAGPESIDPFGLAEFQYKSKGEKPFSNIFTIKPKTSQIKLSCGNCIG